MRAYVLHALHCCSGTAVVVAATCLSPFVVVRTLVVLDVDG